ncbi:hypothetical protein [Pseudacidovorax intermedius]|uniref:hypothetical protein n=1 Tax=Pseudacidovorax intermedius TaxID=433924 RepID=UPI0012DF9E9E|nr:hypothetical protein [Pseudacidovorax intermedius]
MAAFHIPFPEAVCLMAMSTLLDHFRAVRAWAEKHSADATLDMKTFEVEIRCANRYFTFYPQFSIVQQGQLGYVRQLMPAASGFCGWRPYREYKTPLTTDKLLFKSYFASQGLRVPATWPADRQPPLPYIQKRQVGSFGEGMCGPALPSQLERLGMPTPSGCFAEQFIEGSSVKVWLWGARPVCADIQGWPTVAGDGISRIETLIAQRLHGAEGSSFGADRALMLACIRFQGLDTDSIPEPGRSIWIDFRYGRSFRSPSASRNTPNRLPELRQRCGSQLLDAGAAVARGLQQSTLAPVVSSIDAVLDGEGRLWWLELNSNPLFPHHGYDTMLSELFDRPTTSISPSEHGATPP